MGNINGELDQEAREFAKNQADALKQIILTDLLIDGDEFGQSRLLQLSNDKINQIIDSLLIRSQLSEFSNFVGADFRRLGSLIDKQIINDINRISKHNTRDEILYSFLECANSLAEVSMCTYGFHSVEEQNYHPSDSLIERNYLFLKCKREQGGYDPRGTIGEYKTAIELGINMTLSDELSCRLQTSEQPVDVFALVILLFARAQISMTMTVGIRFLDYGRRISLSRQRGLMLPDDFFERYSVDYGAATKMSTYNTDSPNIQELEKKYEGLSGYSADRIRAHLGDYSKFRLNAGLQFITTERLEEDIQEYFEISESGAKNLLQDLTLTIDEEHQKKSSSSSLDLVEDPNERIFRSPIIRWRNHYLYASMVLAEAIEFLKLRILRRNIEEAEGLFNQNDRKKFDEDRLVEVRSRLAQQMIQPYLNVNLNHSSLINNYLRHAPKTVMEEVDLYYVEDRILYIWDLKNYTLQHTVTAIGRVADDIGNERGKLFRLRNIIREHKKVFEDFFDVEFDTVEIGVMTVNLTTYRFFKPEDNCRVLSVDEFLSSAI